MSRGIACFFLCVFDLNVSQPVPDQPAVCAVLCFGSGVWHCFMRADRFCCSDCPGVRPARLAEVQDLDGGVALLRAGQLLSGGTNRMRKPPDPQG